MKKALITMLALLSITTVNAQTVTGNGVWNYISKWTCTPPCIGTSTITNSLLLDNGATVSLGNWATLFPFTNPPAGYMMHIYESGATGTHTVGLDVELFNRAPGIGGIAQGVVMNIQGSETNRGFNTYTAGGQYNEGGRFAANAGTSDNTGIIASGAGGNNAIGGDFSGSGGATNFGVTGTASGGTNCTGGYFLATAIQSTIKNYGLSAKADATNINNASTENYGLHAEAIATATVAKNYGIYTYAESNPSITTPAIGIYAEVKGGIPPNGAGAGSYAGYFKGDVPGAVGMQNAAYFNGQIVLGTALAISDRQFKENINNIENALDKVMKLSPSTYTFKGKDEYPSFNFTPGKQYGFIAQELEQVIPELVSEAINPAIYDHDGNKIDDAVKFKGIKYIELIPVLTAAIQEQQKLITAKDIKISELEERIVRLETMMNNNTTGFSDVDKNVSLFQNNPNPFSGSTEIRYRLSRDYSHAEIVIFDMNGRKIKAVGIQGNEGYVTVSGDNMAEGMYLYSLVLDGQAVATKRMVFTR